MSARNHYVYITVAAVACYRQRLRGLDLVASIAAPRNISVDPEAMERSVREFEAHLDRYPLDRYFIITDNQAEAYQAETVPALSRRDLRLLLNRKLEQRYRTTNYRAVVPHRSRPYAFIRRLTRRRSRTTTRILYALISPEALVPWLDALEGRSINVAGVYSLGALMPALMRYLKVPERSDALLVMRTAAGFRHAFVAPSGLRFSRLCAHSGAGESQVGPEIDKTLQYLAMTRLWRPETDNRPLQIAVIDADPSAVSLTTPASTLRTVDLVQVRPRDLVPKGPAELLDATNSAWLLFNGAALREHGSGCAASLTLQAAGHRANYRRAALGATAVVALASAGYAAFSAMATRELSELATTAELVASHVNATAERGERDTPATNLEPAQLRAVVETRDRLLGRSIDSLGLMQRTAAALAPFPTLAVDRLEWSYLDSASAAADGPSSGVPAPPASNTIVLRVGGHVAHATGKSDANAAVAGLAAALARELRGGQSVDKLPFDNAPGGTLSSKPNESAPEQADFSVTVAVPAAAHTS
jgi:hypothetical protein